MDSLLLSAVTFSASLALFVALYKLVRLEATKGERVVFIRVRAFFDQMIDAVTRLCLATLRSITSAFFQVRQPRPDRELTSALMRHATRTPLTVQHTDNHLSQMRDHKSETALTSAQGRKLRKKKLEERF